METPNKEYVTQTEKIASDKKKKIIIISAIAGVVIIAAIIIALLWTKGFRTIKLLEVFNKVNFDRGEEKDIEIYENMSIQPGDTLGTGGDSSYARLLLDDDKHVYVEENSEVDFEMKGRKKTAKTTIHVNYGAVINEIDNKLTEKQSYEVESPNSLMAVRGTKFRTSTYTGPDGLLYTRVSVFEGEVQCWLVYPDGTVSEESHIAEAGSEILIYYDEESGITDFARINNAGRYNSKEEGDYVRDISYTQMPSQALEYLSKRAEELGGFDSISTGKIKEYAQMSAELKDEPILERYGVTERQLIDEGLLESIRGKEKEAIFETYAQAYYEAEGIEYEYPEGYVPADEEALAEEDTEALAADDAAEAEAEVDANVAAEAAPVQVAAAPVVPDIPLDPDAQQANDDDDDDDDDDDSSSSGSTPSTPPSGGGGVAVTTDGSGHITSSPIAGTTLSYTGSGYEVLDSSGNRANGYSAYATSSGVVTVVDNNNHVSYSASSSSSSWPSTGSSPITLADGGTISLPDGTTGYIQQTDADTYSVNDASGNPIGFLTTEKPGYYRDESSPTHITTYAIQDNDKNIYGWTDTL